MRLNDNVEIYGDFWLPSTPDERIPGQLTIVASGKIALELYGAFGGNDKALDAFNGKSHLGRILGQSSGGQYLTLDNCFYLQPGFGFLGTAKSLIFCHFAYIGIALEEGEQLQISKYQFSVEGLDEWLSIYGIEVKFDTDLKRLSVNCERPESLRFRLPMGLELSINFSWNAIGIGKVSKSTITQKAYITLSSDEAQSFNCFTSLSSKICKFLCFAMDSTLAIDSGEAYIEATTPLHDESENIGPIYIYYRSMPFVDEPKKIEYFNFLFSYNTIKERFEETIKGWFESYEILSPALNLYFSSQFGEHKYIDSRFLSLAQALETFHRRTSDKKQMPEGEFQSLKNILLESCPQENLEWLEERLRYANEMNLRTRLKELICPFKHHFENSDARDRFVNSIVNTRNYLTHYGEGAKDRAVSGGTDFFVLCMKMEALLQFHILRTLGFTDDYINQVAKGNDRISWKLNH